MSSWGVLLVNIGSPTSPTISEVSSFLRRFLMDPKVVDLPWPVRALIVYGLIVPFRARQTAEAYKRIWTDAGSPVVQLSNRLAEKLQCRLSIPVALAMHYGVPSVREQLSKLRRLGVRSVFVLPLFPQYSEATWGSIKASLKREATPLELTFKMIEPYYNEPLYIEALVRSAQPWIERCKGALWLFSFHGLPERQIRKSDPTHQHCLRRPDCCEIPSEAHRFCYRYQCLTTVRLFIRKAGLTHYTIAFQSRIGRGRWLSPYSDDVLRTLPSQGVTEVVTICPSFTVDCLETLEEVAIRGRQVFLQSGGRKFEFVPSLNDHPAWVDVLASWILQGTGT